MKCNPRAPTYFFFYGNRTKKDSVGCKNVEGSTVGAISFYVKALKEK